MRIAVAQIDPVVGDFEGNAKKILEAYQRACAKQARFVLTPELSICGYPPHDLAERPEIFTRCEAVLDQLAAATRDQKTALVVGSIGVNPGEFGRPAQNVVTVLEGGKRTFRQAKTLLPTYDVFDEARYFEPARESQVWVCDGHKIGLAICEDLWAHMPLGGRRLYETDLPRRLKALGAELLCSVSASPFQLGKATEREQTHADVCRVVAAPLVYVNQMCATDEILFDGGSFAMNARGELAGRLPLFKTSFGLVEWEGGEVRWVSPEESAREDVPPSEMALLERALVLGIRDYFKRTGFTHALLGLSGGIDSAVVAVLAALALGPKNVLGVAMPSQYSSSHSLEDAEQLARNLVMPFEVRPIKFAFATLNRELAEGRGVLKDIAQENLQARLRGLVLMTLSNHTGALVLTTGNKSEIAVGYCTLYGDMVGALAPIGDLFKTRVYELARHLNAAHGNVIPLRTLTKAPSAELKPNQKDQDSLPPYDELDPWLERYLEKGQALDLATAPPWLGGVMGLIEKSEYKRRQAAPVLRVSAKAFGIGRRIPIAKTWHF